MDRRTTLADAMQIWRERLTEQETRGRHVATSELYDLAMQHLSPPAAEATLAHLRRCPPCHREWRALLRDLSAAEMTDEVHVQVAAGQRPLERTEVRTKNGMYTIIVRPSASPGEAALITVEVNRPEDRERLAGQMIRLMSQQGRLLLQGEIVAGEVSQFLEAPLTYAELNYSKVECIGELPEET